MIDRKILKTIGEAVQSEIMAAGFDPDGKCRKPECHSCDIKRAVIDDDVMRGSLGNLILSVMNGGITIDEAVVYSMAVGFEFGERYGRTEHDEALFQEDK